MVYLKDLSQQYPLCSTAKEDLSDKEIYTQYIDQEDASKVWKINLQGVMHGFAYVAFRIHVADEQPDYKVKTKLCIGVGNQVLFNGNAIEAKQNTWIPLQYPLTHKMTAIDEDGLTIVIYNHEEKYGCVEVLAQQFGDLLSNEDALSYAFLKEKTDQVEWILTPNNYLYKAKNVGEENYPHPVKVIPTISRLLDKDTPWEDTDFYWPSVSLRI